MHRLSIVASVVVCLVAGQAGAVFASEAPQPISPIASVDLSGAHSRLDVDAAVSAVNLAPPQADAFAAQVYRGRPYRSHRDGSLAAIIIGAAATIAGTAVLVYANRPECSATPSVGGCGYGTKVIGGSVLAGGVVSMMVGALTWR